MNYIGSKYSLLPFISEILAVHQLRNGVFVDLFAGTTAVGRMAKQAGFSVISNDWQRYSYVLGRAYIQLNAYPQFANLRAACPEIFRVKLPQQPNFPQLDPIDLPSQMLPLRQILYWLNHLPGAPGFIYTHYCLGGTSGADFERQYFSDENGLRCDAIKGVLTEWHRAGMITEDEFFLLLTILLEAIDRVANTASVYGAFLKHLKPTARKSLCLEVPRLLLGDLSHRVHQKDANRLVQELTADVLYLDPPYNHRQYNANYHLLETIASDDDLNFIQPTLTGQRANAELTSSYCQKDGAIEAFADLIGAANARHIMVSYNDEGIIPVADMGAILRRRGQLTEHRKTYKRFRADQDRPGRQYAQNDVVHELLFHVEVVQDLRVMVGQLHIAYLESVFRTALARYNELLVANCLIEQYLPDHAPYDLQDALARLNMVLGYLDAADLKRTTLLKEWQNIEQGAGKAVEQIIRLISPGQIKAVQLVEGKAKTESLLLTFDLAGQTCQLSLSLKIERTGKVSLTEVGQTSDLYAWFQALFDMPSAELDQLVSKVFPGRTLSGLRQNYFDIAQLLRQVFIIKLGLVDDYYNLAEQATLNQAHPTNQPNLLLLLRQLKQYKSGSAATVIITDRETGAVTFDTALDQIVLDTLDPADTSVRTSKVKPELSLRYGRTVLFTVEVKPHRGKTTPKSAQPFFHNLTMRLSR